MKLVWTYNILAKVGNKTEERKTILINYYIISIQEAKKLGYYCVMYTDSFSVKYFENLVDEIHVFDNYENSVQWDCYKIKVLEDRDDDFCLIDGDVILQSKLPEFKADVVFDTYEVANWKIEYEPVIKQFTELGIGDILEEWDDTKKYVFSCGILYFKDNKYKKLYVQQWKKYNNFLNEKLKDNKIDIDVATMVGGQYLVTLIANHNNLSTSYLTTLLGNDGPYYKHHCGIMKYDRPIVPRDRIIDLSKKVLL
jgi:hypothetical protein